MPDFVLVSGDTEPILSDTLEYSSQEPVNLEGATVTFTLRSPTSTEPVKLTGTVTVQEAKTGKVFYTPTASDTGTTGNYMGSWHVKFAGGETQTFPTEGWLWVQIQPNLTNESAALLVGLDEVKDHLSIPAEDRTRDNSLQRFIKGATPLIEDLTGPILPRVYDEWHEGGHSTLSVRHRPSYGYGTSPIFELMAVSEYRGPIEYNLSLVPTPTAGTVYSVMGNEELGTIVRRTSGGGTVPFWSDPSHPSQSIHVVYYAGQKQTPDNVNMAVLETVAWWYRTTLPVGRGSQTQADEEGGRPMVSLPYHAEKMLAPTRRPPVCA
jgi:hypothetical protein